MSLSRGVSTVATPFSFSHVRSPTQREQEREGEDFADAEQMPNLKKFNGA